MGRTKKKSVGTQVRTPTPAELAIRQAFAMRLRSLREGLGLTQGQMAARCGLSKVYYGVVELSKKSASLETIARLADGMGVAPAELLRFDAPSEKARETPAERLGRQITSMARSATPSQISKFERVARVLLERE
jgi:transcriptional regulator with XRE-family HTH domain